MNKQKIKNDFCSAVDSAAKNIESYTNDIATRSELEFNEKHTFAKLAT